MKNHIKRFNKFVYMVVGCLVSIFKKLVVALSIEWSSLTACQKRDVTLHSPFFTLSSAPFFVRYKPTFNFANITLVAVISF